jgi:hypothetical protein
VQMETNALSVLASPNQQTCTVGPQSGFRNWRAIRWDAVTPMTETRTKCTKSALLGAPQCTCPISWTVSTGSSPSTRRRLASVPPTPSLFASSRLPGAPLASSSKSVSSKCWRRRGLAHGRDVELRPDRPRGHQDPQDSARRSQERSTVPDDPAESERLRWRLADRGPRLQGQTYAMQPSVTRSLARPRLGTRTSPRRRGSAAAA